MRYINCQAALLCESTSVDDEQFGNLETSLSAEVLTKVGHLLFTVIVLKKGTL